VEIISRGPIKREKRCSHKSKKGLIRRKNSSRKSPSAASDLQPHLWAPATMKLDFLIFSPVIMRASLFGLTPPFRGPLSHSGKYLLRQRAHSERETFYFFLYLFSSVCAYSYITGRPITSILQAVKKFSNKALLAGINGPRRDSSAPVTIDFFHLAALFVPRLAPVWPIFPPRYTLTKAFIRTSYAEHTFPNSKSADEPAQIFLELQLPPRLACCGESRKVFSLLPVVVGWFLDLSGKKDPSL